MHYRLISSILASHSLELSSSHVFVNFTGGTPEPIVGAIVAGFRTVIMVVEDDIQALMYQMPSVEQEKAGFDYYDYQSPDDLMPSMGILAAEAVRLLAPLLRNTALNVDTPFRVPLFRELELPAEVKYEYVPVLQAIRKRTIIAADGDHGAQGAAEGAKKAAPSIKAPKGRAKVGSRKRKASAENEDGGEDEDEEVVDGNEEVEDAGSEAEEDPLEDELAALNAMQKQQGPASMKKKGKAKAKVTK